MALNPLFTRTPKTTNATLLAIKVQITTTESTYAKRLFGLHITSNDSAAQFCTIFYHDGTTEVTVGVVTVPALAASINGVINVMATLNTFFTKRDSAGNIVFDIPVGAYFSATLTTLTSGKLIYSITQSELYDPNGVTD